MSNFDKIMATMRVCEAEVKSATKKVVIAKSQVALIDAKINAISLNGNPITLSKDNIDLIIVTLKDNLKKSEEKLNTAKKDYNSFKSSVSIKTETKNNKKEV